MAFPGRGGQPTKTRSRYPGIDILRGLALISMASTHISHYQLDGVIVTVLHRGLWIDGAFFFVALSGVVVGLVHRRIVDRAGLRPSVIKLARRAGFLYLVHVALVLFAVLAAWVDPDDIIAATPPWTGMADVPEVLRQVFILRLEPAYNGVLSMYVVFMLLGIPAVVLLRRGRWRTVVAGSLAIYAAGWLIGGVSFAPDDFSLTAWQALFIGGLLVGWTWEHERLRLPLHRRRRIVQLCFVGAAGFLGMAVFAPGLGGRVFGRTLDKMSGGPMAFVYAAVVLVAGYVLIEWVLRWRPMGVLLIPVRILGTKGLPGFVALQVTTVLIDLFPGFPRNDGVLIGVLVICGITEYLTFTWQERRRRPPQPPPAPSDIAGEEPTVEVRPAPAVVAPYVDLTAVDGERRGWSNHSPVTARGQRSWPG